MNNKYNRKHVFDKEGNLLPIEDRTYVTNEGYELVLIDGGTRPNYITVRIEDWVSEVQLGDVKRGQVRYVFHPSVYDIGYLGVGKYTVTKDKKHTPVYATWHSMLRRCYCSKSHGRQPTYKDVTVHHEWHNFQNFAEWFEQSNYQESWHLDKDLLSKGEKKYSKETCLFLPDRLNTFLTNRQVDNTSGYVGVSYDKRYNNWNVKINDKNTGSRMYLGYFDDIEEASNAYKKQRAIFAEEWKAEMQGMLPQQAIDSIK